jgi:uncharacterized protein YbjT (DUF2867 family)
MAAVAREAGVTALVNMSQMTVSEMSIQNTTSSHQQRQHWLAEQALAWSGLPVITIRPTMFLESFLPLAAPSVRERGRIELPFGRCQGSRCRYRRPCASCGPDYELTGPRSQDMNGVAEEFSGALNRHIVYSDISPEEWERELRT